MGAIGGAFAVALEHAVLDQDRAAVAGAAEDAVLVVEEARIADRQIAPLGADAGAVLIGDARAREGDVVDGDVVAGDHPDRLAAARPVAQVSRAVGRFQGQAARAPDRAVDVLAGVDAHDVAILGHRGGGARGLQVALRADQEHCFAAASAPPATRSISQTSNGPDRRPVGRAIRRPILRCRRAAAAALQTDERLS